MNKLRPILKSVPALLALLLLSPSQQALADTLIHKSGRQIQYSGIAIKGTSFQLLTGKGTEYLPWSEVEADSVPAMLRKQVADSITKAYAWAEERYAHEDYEKAAKSYKIIFDNLAYLDKSQATKYLNEQIIHKSQAKFLHQGRWVTKNEYAKEMDDKAKAKNEQEGLTQFGDEWVYPAESKVLAMLDKAWSDVEGKSRKISYTVNQVLSDGILGYIERRRYGDIDVESIYIHADGPIKVAEKDQVNEQLYWSGTYSYTSQKGIRTVNAYSTTADAAKVRTAINLGYLTCSELGLAFEALQVRAYKMLGINNKSNDVLMQSFMTIAKDYTTENSSSKKRDFNDLAAMMIYGASSPAPVTFQVVDKLVESGTAEQGNKPQEDSNAYLCVVVDSSDARVYKKGVICGVIHGRKGEFNIGEKITDRFKFCGHWPHNTKYGKVEMFTTSLEVAMALARIQFALAFEASGEAKLLVQPVDFALAGSNDSVNEKHEPTKEVEKSSPVNVGNVTQDENAFYLGASNRAITDNLLLRVPAKKSDLPYGQTRKYTHADLPVWEMSRRHIPVFHSFKGRRFVIPLHPEAHRTPTILQFEEITKSTKGRLTLSVTGIAEDKTGKIVVKLDGNTVWEVVPGQAWHSKAVDFDHNSISVECHATRWFNDWCYITYDFQDFK